MQYSFSIEGWGVFIIGGRDYSYELADTSHWIDRGQEHVAPAPGPPKGRGGTDIDAKKLDEGPFKEPLRGYNMG